jgi:hypothetical protein
LSGRIGFGLYFFRGFLFAAMFLNLLHSVVDDVCVQGLAVALVVLAQLGQHIKRGVDVNVVFINPVVKASASALVAPTV